MQAAQGLLLSTADTELLAAHAAGVSWRIANPARLDPSAIADLIENAAFAVVRLLGGRQTWPDGLDRIVASGLPVVVLGGEATPDAQLQALSTVPAGVVREAMAYLVAGGAENLRELHRFLSDTLLMTGEGFAPPIHTPDYAARPDREVRPDRPTIGVVYYRAHELAGNTSFVDTLCTALEDVGANALPVYCSSLRSIPDGLRETLRGCDALVVTVLAAGGTNAGDASAGGDDEAWSVDALAELEWAAGATDPYRNVARLFHILAQRQPEQR